MRQINAHFETPGLLEQIGMSVHKLLKENETLYGWTEGRIHRSAAMVPVDGMLAPNILVGMASAQPQFFPGGKERNTVRVWVQVTIEEPNEILEEADRTISTVEEEIRATLIKDTTLLAGGTRGRAVRLDRFELINLDGRADDDKTTLWFDFVAVYLADLDAMSRNRLALK